MPTTPRIEAMTITSEGTKRYVILDHQSRLAFAHQDVVKAAMLHELAKAIPDYLVRAAKGSSAPEAFAMLYAAIEAERVSGELTPTDGTADTEAQPDD